MDSLGGVGRWMWTTSHPAVELGDRERGRMPMTEMFHACILRSSRSQPGALARAGIERGASMVEYALLVGLIAIVAVVTIAFLVAALLVSSTPPTTVWRTPRAARKAYEQGKYEISLRESSPFPKRAAVGLDRVSDPARCRIRVSLLRRGEQRPDLNDAVGHRTWHFGNETDRLLNILRFNECESGNREF